jgi:hypothetical protein
MGRGLSGLQKTILTIALRNKVVEGGDYVHVVRPEVFHEHYGFPYRNNAWDCMSEYYIRQVGTRCPIATRLDLRQHNAFSRLEIGAARYDRAEVAVCKAFQRLERRGLVVAMYWSDWSLERTGANLTTRGTEEAARLLGKEATPCSLRSQYVAVWGESALSVVLEDAKKPRLTRQDAAKILCPREETFQEALDGLADLTRMMSGGASSKPTLEQIDEARRVLAMPANGKPLIREDLEARYRLLVKQTHPDMEGGNADRFKQVEEAYRTLRYFL